MKNSAAAFQWMVGILRRQEIPFLVTGGLAAKVYGSPRELADIDFDVPEERIPDVQALVEEYVIYGPELYRDNSWKLQLMTLDYEGQLIDINGAFQAQLYDRTIQQWRPCIANFDNAEHHTVFDLEVPLTSRQDLIRYKQAIARDVDLEDLRHIQRH